MAKLWVTENVGHDALVQATAVVERTHTIGVGTGIAYAFTRNPVAAAIAAQNIQVRSEERFVFGLGAGTRGLRRRFGADFDHPAPRLVEYADLMRQVWTGETVEFSGTYYEASVPGWGRQQGLPAPMCFGSGLNAVMLTYAAAGFDGVALHPLGIAPAYLSSVVGPAMQEGRSRRTLPATASLSTWVLASVADDAELARDQARRALAFYFSTPSYQNAAAGSSWEESAGRIRDGFKATRQNPDWNELGRLVPDEMVNDLVAWGTPDQARAALERIETRLAAYGVDEIVLQPVGKGTPKEAHDAALAVVDALAR